MFRPSTVVPNQLAAREALALDGLDHNERIAFARWLEVHKDCMHLQDDYSMELFGRLPAPEKYTTRVRLKLDGHAELFETTLSYRGEGQRYELLSSARKLLALWAASSVLPCRAVRGHSAP